MIYYWFRILWFNALKTGIHLDHGWRTSLRARTQIVDKFRRNPFACPLELWRAK